MRQTLDYSNAIDAVSSDFYSNEFAVVYDSQATISNFNNVTIYVGTITSMVTPDNCKALEKVLGVNLTRYPKQQ